jgi:hypothetical protein
VSTLEGTVLDAAGKPVSGARVDIATAAPRVGQGMFCPSCYRDCAKWVQTDESGRFTIGGLDPTLKFQLLWASPGKEAQVTKLIDPLAGPITLTLENLPSDLPPERTVRGVVVNEAGVPIAGALIDPEGAKTSSRHWGGPVDARAAVSDHEGRFVMLLPSDYLGIDVKVTADGYAGTSIALLKPGAEEHRIKVPVGTRVGGRLAHFGGPVAGMRIAVVQMDRSSDNHFIKAVEAITDFQGNFALEYLPANQDYCIFTPVLGNKTDLVLTTKRFRAHSDGQTRDLGTLEVVTGLRLAGRVELPAGVSLPQNARLAFGRDPAWDLVSAEIQEDGRFEIGPLPPETYEVRLSAKGLEIDTANMNYQPLRYQSFGIALRESLLDLRIPLQTTAATP